MADNGLLDPAIANGIERTRGVKHEGVRAGNWLLKEQANELLNPPDPSALKGKRDRAILALLISCELRRAELVGVEVDKSSSARGAGSYRIWWEKGTDFASSRYPPR